MASEPDPEAQAARHATAALEYIQQLLRDHAGNNDAQVAAALSNLAVYEQMRALTHRQQETVERVRSNTDTLEHLAGGLSQLIKTGEEIHFVIGRLDRTVEYAAQSPIRRAAEHLSARWQELRLRHMPVPPISDTVRRPEGHAPHTPVTPMHLVDTLTGTKFEELLVALLKRAGWETVEHIGGSGDMGVDVLARSGDTVLAVQAKRHGKSSQVTSPALTSFVGGAREYHNATVLTLVTTNDKYSPDARKFLENAPISVVDRAATASWVERGIVPEAVQPPGYVADATAEEPELVPPPLPPRRPQAWTAALLLASLGPVTLAARFPNFKVASLAATVVITLLIGALWANFHWRAHGWQVGVRRYWPGWTVDNSSDKPVFVPPT